MKVCNELLEAREKAIALRESSLKSQRQSFELQKSQHEEGLRKRENDLQRRIKEFEAEMRFRRSEWDQKTQERREVNEPQRSMATSLIIPGQSLSMAGVFQRISQKYVLVDL